MPELEPLRIQPGQGFFRHEVVFLVLGPANLEALGLEPGQPVPSATTASRGGPGAKSERRPGSPAQAPLRRSGGRLGFFCLWADITAPRSRGPSPPAWP